MLLRWSISWARMLAMAFRMVDCTNVTVRADGIAGLVCHYERVYLLINEVALIYEVEEADVSKVELRIRSLLSYLY